MRTVAEHISQPGAFITFEGIDGCGKSTQAARLVALLAAGGREVVAIREPGGTAISEKIRALLLDPDNAAMTADCELLLYEASRAQLVREVVAPALERGAVVVCDRYYDSTMAYQQAARGLDASVVAAANRLGSCGVDPDVTILLDLEPERGLARATEGGADRLEGEGVPFQRAVREGYLELASACPERIAPVDANGSEDEVFSRVLDAVVASGVIVGLTRGA